MFGRNVKGARRTLKEALAVVSRSIATQSAYKETNQAVRKFPYSSALLSIISYCSAFFSSSRRVESLQLGGGHVLSNLGRWTLRKLEEEKGATGRS